MAAEDISKEWALDITNEPEDGVGCFCPIDTETGTVTVGLMLLQSECPGKLVALYSMNGQEHVDEWAQNHPTWHKDFAKKHSNGG